MTQVKYVNRNEMIDRTGMDALGYSQPKNALILLREGMPKDLEMKVRSHEFEHMKKGEEGPFWGAVIAGVNEVRGMYNQKRGRDEAIEDVENANREANSLLKQGYESIQGRLTPYQEIGRPALNRYNEYIMGDGDPNELLGRDPGYQFRRDEGQNALTNYLGTTGMRLSGRALKEASRYNQGFASQEYGNALNRLKSVADYGQWADQEGINSDKWRYGGQSQNTWDMYMNRAALKKGMWDDFTSLQQKGGEQAAASIGGMGMGGGGGGGGMGSMGAMAGMSTGGAAGILCDRRLKTNVKKVADWFGINIYEFEYLWGEKGKGPMSDEVNHLPGVVSKHETGYDMVNLDALYKAVGA